MPKTKAFQYKQRSLEVRVTDGGTQWVVRVYEGNQPANRVQYTVDKETAEDAWHSGDKNLIDRLMETAQKDFLYWADYQPLPEDMPE